MERMAWQPQERMLKQKTGEKANESCFQAWFKRSCRLAFDSGGEYENREMAGSSERMYDFNMMKNLLALAAS